MPKILIVEDDSFLADIYITKFRAAGFDVEVANDGKEGITKVQEQKPDVILLDIVMPNMDGFEMLRTIRADSEYANMKIILLTNLGQKEEVDKGLTAGADAYIIKAHYTPTEVVAKVQEILN